MKRVMIIGSPGTGKSVFARKLASRTGLPLVHLDYYYHDPTQEYYHGHNKRAWQDKVESLTTQNTWIIDGKFASTMAERAQRADTIFYFDIPRRVAIRGVLKRRVTVSRTKRTDMPDSWREKLDWLFLKYVWGFRKKYAASTEELLKSKHGKHVVVFKNRKQTEKYLDGLEA